jgi:hypothetical protein
VPLEPLASRFAVVAFFLILSRRLLARGAAVFCLVQNAEELGFKCRQTLVLVHFTGACRIRATLKGHRGRRTRKVRMAYMHVCVVPLLYCIPVL